MAHLGVVKSNAENGTSNTPPPAPFKYTVLKWRLATNTSREGAIGVLLEEMLEELDMLDLENKFKPTK